MGWYRCGNCGEAFYAADTDSEYEDYHAYRADRAQQRGAPPQIASMPTARVLKPPRITTKDKQIVGNLYRSNTGKFTAGGSPSDAPPRFGKAPKKSKAGKRASAKPKKVAQTPEQRIAAAEAKRQQNVNDVGDQLDAADTLAGIGAYNKGQPLDPAIQQDIVDAGLGELGRDGAMRLTAQGREALHAAQRGDVGAARDAMSRARDAKTTGQERATAQQGRQAAAQTRREQVAARREAAAAAKKPAKAASGGGKKTPAKAAPAKIPTKAAPKRSAAPSGGGGSSGGGSSAAPKAPAAAKPTAADRSANVAQRMADSDTGLSPSGSKALTAFAGGTQPDKTQGAGLVSMGLADQAPDGSYRMTPAGRAVVSAMNAGDYQRTVDAISRASEPKPAAKSFTVFKDHTGAHRWLARTTTAYRDRDGEIISEAALDADSQRMTTTKQFGPLRYWHVGQPDPFDDTKPWGPGLDIGDCDYSVVIGRTRIESGTFRNPQIAQKMAAAADRHEMSPGFFHPLDQPDSSGVFNSIRTFERSPVPKRYGRASNLFTGFTVKEFRMDLTEMERRFKAMYSELGLTPEQGMELGQSLVATEKAATEQGIAFKSDDAPAVAAWVTANDQEAIYYDPGSTPGVIRGGQWVALKAFPPKADADEPSMDEEETVEETVVDEQPEAEMAGDYLGDMSWDEFAGKLSELLAPVLKMQDMVKAMGDAHQELKGMYGGVATKDDARALELATLKSSLAELTNKIAQIEGDQPATILPDEVAEALKSGGPEQPQEPERTAITQAVNDPTRPFAGWGIQTFPELYQNGENA